jgi:hypothetical protein
VKGQKKSAPATQLRGDAKDETFPGYKQGGNFRGILVVFFLHNYTFTVNGKTCDFVSGGVLVLFTVDRTWTARRPI